MNVNTSWKTLQRSPVSPPRPSSGNSVNHRPRIRCEYSQRTATGTSGRRSELSEWSWKVVRMACRLSRFAYNIDWFGDTIIAHISRQKWLTGYHSGTAKRNLLRKVENLLERIKYLHFRYPFLRLCRNLSRYSAGTSSDWMGMPVYAWLLFHSASGNIVSPTEISNQDSKRYLLKSWLLSGTLSCSLFITLFKM